METGFVSGIACSRLSRADRLLVSLTDAALQLCAHARAKMYTWHHRYGDYTDVVTGADPSKVLVVAVMHMLLTAAGGCTLRRSNCVTASTRRATRGRTAL